MAKAPAIPANIEAEESVLGAMMIAPDVPARVIGRVQADDFYRPAHVKLFETCVALFSRGEPVDAVTVVQRLREQGSLEEVGGALAVFGLVEGTASPAAAVYYARIVSEQALLRRIVTAGHQAAEMARGPGEPADIATLAEHLMFEAVRHDEAARMRTVHVQEAIVDGLEALEQRVQGEGLYTGFRDVDALVGALQPGNLVIVAARPGVGKTSFVTNVARNVAAYQREPAVMFSMEMTRAEIGQRLACDAAQVRHNAVRPEHWSSEEWARIVEAPEHFKDVPLHVDDRSTVTVPEMRATIRTLPGTALVVVDYVQLVTPHESGRNREQEVAAISRALKVLAKSVPCVVVACSQMNRALEGRTDKRPQLSDLRESGGLEQDADLVAFLHRKEGEPTKAALIVAKHRNGPTGEVPLDFIPAMTAFRDRAN